MARRLLSVPGPGLMVLTLVVSCAGRIETLEPRIDDRPPRPGWIFETGG